MSSYQIEVDKNTGERSMIVENPAGHVSLTMLGPTVNWEGFSFRSVARPQKGVTSAHLVRVLKESIENTPWKMVDMHIEETDQGPLVIMVCK